MEACVEGHIEFGPLANPLSVNADRPGARSLTLMHIDPDMREIEAILSEYIKEMVLISLALPIYARRY